MSFNADAVHNHFMKTVARERAAFQKHADGKPDYKTAEFCTRGKVRCHWPPLAFHAYPRSHKTWRLAGAEVRMLSVHSGVGEAG